MAIVMLHLPDVKIGLTSSNLIEEVENQRLSAIIWKVL
ncbi:MAG: hypothetical protein KatS3mg057_0874 [Herpetosiphonaceae bacterium]|nr:MAG: hypothetical protein KatS3mg057_0874 [Herpetosiphonaceae bacterium]